MTDTVRPEQVLEVLRQIQDPDLHRDIVELGFVKDRPHSTAATSPSRSN